MARDYGDDRSKIKNPKLAKPKMSMVQVKELNEWLMERVKEGKTYSTIIRESRALGLPIGDGQVEVYYYRLLKVIRAKWENTDYLGDMKSWIKESYLNLYEKAVYEGNKVVARQVLNDLTKLSGINITKETQEVTVVDSTIKFKFDTPDENG